MLKNTNDQTQIKYAIVNGLKETIFPDNFSITDSINQGNVDLSFQEEPLPIISKSFARSVKNFVGFSLTKEIDSALKESQLGSRETWKIDAHNLSKTLINKSKMSCVQENLSNILDTCLSEIDLNSSQLNQYCDSEIDFSPLLQPEHLIEIVECISSENPLDVRLNALNVLLKSHFSEAINGDGWILLQKKLIQNLHDNNMEVFNLSLKAHAKLASCSSPLALKECILNIIESLGQHYYSQESDEKPSLNSIHFYRMVHLTALLLKALREATLNVSRFGESKLEEIIINLVQLLSLHTQKQQGTLNYGHMSPLEVVSVLDPHGYWLENITHFNLTRQIFFSSICRNITFLKTVMTEIVDWLLKPVIPSKSHDNVSLGEFDTTIKKYGMFCHGLSVFVRINSFGIGQRLFPIDIFVNKDECLSVGDVLNLIISLINDTKFQDMISQNSNENFKKFIENSISKLLNLNCIDPNLFLVKILGKSCQLETLGITLNSMKISILNSLTNNTFAVHTPQIPNTDTTPKRKISSTANTVLFDTATNEQKSSEVTLNQEDKLPSRTEVPCSEVTKMHPLETYSKYLMTQDISDLRTNLDTFKILVKIPNYFEKTTRNSFESRIQFIQFIAKIYCQVQEGFNHVDSTFDETSLQLSDICSTFFLQLASSSTVFQVLRDCNTIGFMLSERLLQPVLDWHNPQWLNFVSRAIGTSEGVTALGTKYAGSIFKNEFEKLWNVIEEDCSGSDLPIENATIFLLNIISVMSLNSLFTKAMFCESNDGSDKTLTEEYDLRPTNIMCLIQQFALNEENCPSFIHHEFALKVLEILTVNIDSSLYLLNKLKYDEILLRLQSENRTEENTDVIIDECSLSRQRIIAQSHLPGRLKSEIKPSHLPQRPESTFSRAKPRSRGTGEFTRWLSETKLGLHDQNWLKHARKLYQNTSPDEVKGSSMIDLTEKIINILTTNKTIIDWANLKTDGLHLSHDEQLAVQLAIRYGTHHRIIQPTQQNIDNLSQIILLTKGLKKCNGYDFEGFDWFVASVYLLCTGNMEKVQMFLSQVYILPGAPLLWIHCAKPSVLAQIGDALDVLLLEEMPTLYYGFRNSGLSCWQLFQTWISQCWWNILEWTQICHWITLSVLYEPDNQIYFCLSIIHANYDHILRMVQDKAIYQVILNPTEKFNLVDAKVFIDKMYKKYHNSLNSQLIRVLNS